MVNEVGKQLGMVLIALCCCTSLCAGQDVRAVARVDSNSILIGSWLKLTLEVQHPDDIAVKFPPLTDSLAGLEIVKQDSIARTVDAHTVVESETFTITAFDSGMFVIPPLKIPYHHVADTAFQFAETLPLAIFVHGISVDSTKGLKDIKPPLSVSITFAELLPYMIGLVLVVGLVWLAIYIWKKRKKGESLLPEAPPRPPHEIALEELRALESESLWERGKIKEYHSQLTDILRIYIERQFHIATMEMVTDEILNSSDITSLHKESQRELRSILTLADYVKFAKLHPAPEENSGSLRTAFAFVEATWRTVPQPIDLALVEEM